MIISGGNINISPAEIKGKAWNSKLTVHHILKPCSMAVVTLYYNYLLACCSHCLNSLNEELSFILLSVVQSKLSDTKYTLNIWRKNEQIKIQDCIVTKALIKCKGISLPCLLYKICSLQMRLTLGFSIWVPRGNG